jgi:ABC-type antimicrobial peptide transport system permease subunit
MALVVVGAVAGVVASLALVRLLASLLHDIGAYDLATLALATAFLLVVGLVASFLPARAATKVDPVTAIAR